MLSKFLQFGLCTDTMKHKHKITTATFEERHALKSEKKVKTETKKNLHPSEREGNIIINFAFEDEFTPQYEAK